MSPTVPLQVTVTDADALTQALDGTGESWTLHRAWDKKWVVTLGDGRDDPSSRIVYGRTIFEALTAAVASPRLPVYPKRPPPLEDRYNMTPRNLGGSHPWAMGGAFFKTKREALAAAERWQAAHAEKVAEWDARFGPLTAGKAEGVDFRWSER